MSRVRILYLVGSGRSGSTLLARLLQEQAGYEAVGEPMKLNRDRVRERTCGCGLTQQACPRWGPHLERLARPEAAESWRRAIEAGGLDRLRHFARPQHPPAGIAAGLEIMREVYEGLAAETGAVLVDTSKKVSYGTLLSTAPWADVRFVEVVRDPRDVVQSWHTPKQTEGISSDGDPAVVRLRSHAPESVAKYWVRRNQASALARRRLRRPWLRLPMSRLVDSPLAALELVVGGPVSGLEREQHGWAFTAGDNHIFNGNPDKVKRGKEVLRPSRPPGQPKARDWVAGPYEERAVRYWDRHLAGARVLGWDWA